MTDLFGHKSSGAEFSPCRKYRYVLWRIWDNDLPVVGFIGLNPSTASEWVDDPTIRRVKSFALKWGYGGFYMMNLFALVSPYPEDLSNCADPLGDNDQWLDKIERKCDKVVFAWGTFFEAKQRAQYVIDRYSGHALLLNKDGSPRHPLYVPANTIPIKYQYEKAI